MLPSQSPGWNGLQALRSHLSDRLARFIRRANSRGRPDKRPDRLQNNAAFFEADLRYILNTALVIAPLSPSDFDSMDQMAHDLLASLNAMVNHNLLASLQGLDEDEPDYMFHSFEGRASPPAYSQAVPVTYSIATLDDDYPNLSLLVDFLGKTAPERFNLVVGPPDSALFHLSDGPFGEAAIERAVRWRAFLERLVNEAHTPEDVYSSFIHQTQLPVEDSAQQTGDDVSEKRASILLNAIFSEFRRRDCGETHEIRLKVSDEWYTKPAHEPALDMFVSGCPDRSIWQEARIEHECEDKEIKESMCNILQRARERGKKLYLFVDGPGFFDISDRMQSSSEPSSGTMITESLTLSELFDQKAFRRMSPSDYLDGKTEKIYSTQEKALLALTLARCLMDFIDQDLDLASYTWKPESIYFPRSSDSHLTTYLLLRPKPFGHVPLELLKSIGPGNPVLLAFAKLLLEIDFGEKIQMDIQPESSANAQKWGQLCAFVDNAEKNGNSDYLRAVEGCLYLHMGMPRHQHQQTASAASKLLRKAIHEKVVRYLELIVHPQTSKRKRRDSTSELPLAKKTLIPYENPEETPPSPDRRDKFEIAILCALPREYNAVSLLIDEFYDEDGDCYGRAVGDKNVYTTGRIGKFHVVLVLLSNMGKVSATGAAASLRSSYPQLRIALVIGICGGVPRSEAVEELILGDVVISKTIVQYDLGRQYADGFMIRDTVEDRLGRPDRNISNLLALFETDRGRMKLEERTATFLEDIQNSTGGRKYLYPGPTRDILFQPSYQHRHHHPLSMQCTCAKHQEASNYVCEKSRELSCEVLGCETKYLVPRERLTAKSGLDPKAAQAPSIFVGRVGSGDKLMKFGLERDRIAEENGILAFEMEGTGVWDQLPSIVIKGVCDYADSHKNKLWQNFAAATAASAAKALLERYPKTDKSC
ncbi:hypothetical protein B0T17DRAFT_587393 [Bombardia bombarda]|uniref:Nucleoside phosphorylase domain-containing protein n=1 Tax=Bombardia bombarda TaxID=252184 RepID=A0AA39XM20_9PEZI|nr:hypothetical protein B0T17DRAFT_587393 [Bombardia bombarda]